VAIGVSCKRPNLFDMQPQFERLTDDQWKSIFEQMCQTLNMTESKELDFWKILQSKYPVWRK